MASIEAPGRRLLWRHRDFLHLWAGETVSLFGSRITDLALPLTAVVTLKATPAEVGGVNAARYAPFLLVSLFAGVYVDRRRRRPVLLRANLGRALLVGAIPLAAALDLLRIELLYPLVFLVGTLTVFFDVAYMAFVPAVVSADKLTDANSKLQTSASAADVGGPGLGGLLVQALGAPFALAADAVSYLFSAATLARIRADEEEPDREEGRRLRDDLGDGLQFVLGHRYLRVICAEAATYNLFEQALLTVFVLFAIRGLGLSAGELGLILSLGAVGAIVGSVTAPRWARRLGTGGGVVASMLVGCATPIALPFVNGSDGAVVAVDAALFFVAAVGIAASNVLVVTLRQQLTPAKLLGRMTASYRMFTYGAIPLGALLGGFLAGAIGLRGALLASAVGLATAPLWVVFSPLRQLRDPAAGAEDVAAERRF